VDQLTGKNRQSWEAEDTSQDGPISSIK
jgi:hypothetical protein